MNQLLRPTLELAVIFPAALLCFLALGEHVRIRRSRLILLSILILGAWVLAGGWVCGSMGWESNVMLVFLPIFALILLRLCDLPAWKPVSVFLGVCGAFSCLSNLCSAIDVWAVRGNAGVWFSLPVCLAYNGACWIFVLVMWYPATHAVRHLLRETEMPGTWYAFWVLPLAFTLLNIVIQPDAGREVTADRLAFLFSVIELMLLGMLLLCYLLFYLMARGLGKNMRLQQQNQFLQMQTSQYEALQTAIAETRQARHDLRHHFTAIDALLRREEWQELRSYVDTAVENLPHTELNLCENPAADGVAGHYAALLRREGVPAEYRSAAPAACGRNGCVRGALQPVGKCAGGQPAPAAFPALGPGPGGGPWRCRSAAGGGKRLYRRDPGRQYQDSLLQAPGAWHRPAVSAPHRGKEWRLL